MDEPIMARQHAISIAPDVLLFLVGTTLFLETSEIARRLPEFQASILMGVCETVGLLLFLIGAMHFLCWLGFRLEIHSQVIVIHRCWFFKKHISLIQPMLTIQATQNNLDELLDKGTLVIFSPGGDIITLSNLANFSQLAPRLARGRAA